MNLRGKQRFRQPTTHRNSGGYRLTQVEDPEFISAIIERILSFLDPDPKEPFDQRRSLALDSIQRLEQEAARDAS